MIAEEEKETDAKLYGQLLQNDTLLVEVHLESHTPNHMYGKVNTKSLPHSTSVAKLQCIHKVKCVGMFQEIEEMLRFNSSLKEIYCTGNDYEDEAAKSIAYGLRQNKSVSRLHLWRHDISIEGCKALETLLQTNDFLRELDLGSNRIGNDGVHLVSNGLKHNNTLTILKLDNNKIIGDGWYAIGQLLSLNDTLQELVLGDNYIGNKGIKFITDGLKHNKTLLKLNLYRCGISYLGCHFIEQMLYVNTSLKQLDLYWNCIDNDGAELISNGLQHNTTIRTVNFDSSSLVVDRLLQCEFYLLLNKGGRQSLLLNNYENGEANSNNNSDATTKCHWIETLIQVSSEEVYTSNKKDRIGGRGGGIHYLNIFENVKLSCLYHVLSLRPELCALLE